MVFYQIILESYYVKYFLESIIINILYFVENTCPGF
jgi:hypothetical protein